MSSKAEYKFLTSYINLTREHLERENDALEQLLFIILELEEECGQFSPFLNSCLRTFKRLSNLLSPYDFYEAGKRLYKANTRSSTYAFALYLEEVKDKPDVKTFRNIMRITTRFSLQSPKRKS